MKNQLSSKIVLLFSVLIFSTLACDALVPTSTPEAGSAPGSTKVPVVNSTGTVSARTPTGAQGFDTQGLSDIKTGSYDAAIADFTQAIQLEPGYAEAYLGRGQAYGLKSEYDFSAANYDPAIADLNKAIELKPDYSNAYFYRGEIYLMLQKNDLAIADFNKVVTLNNDPNWVRQAQDALNQLGVK
jgi:tetratricopeptide (TPR) repeat protein